MNISYKTISTLAFYLPQFHEVEENSLWWGKGYTDWTAAKKAISLYKGHKQPKVPLNNYYYDLTNKDTLIWQADLMHKYGIDGLCFYHYYFKDGKKILEKPAENLLQWKDIDMPFCFAWANGSWRRSWSNIAGKTGWTWNEVEKQEAKIEGNGLLLDQKYGREPEWKEHFEYLLPFFNDPRYIRYNDAPVFIFHGVPDIPCLYAMCKFWRKMAKESGFSDLYLIGMSQNAPGLDAVIYSAPHLVWDINNAVIENGVRRPSFDAAWRNLLNYKPDESCRIYFEGMGDYDDTPRRGNISGIAFKDYSVDKLEGYMEELYLKSYASDNAFLFYNAWNEWGEGMFLEPDEDDGYGRLEALKTAKERAKNKVEKKGDAAFAKYKALVCDAQINKKKSKEYESALARVQCLSEMLGCIEENLDISTLLKRNNIHSIAIYGMGVVGRHLAAELEKCSYQINYFIDKRVINRTLYKRYSLEDNLPPVDAVIVTPISDFDSIYDLLSEKMDTMIISVLELFKEAE